MEINTVFSESEEGEIKQELKEFQNLKAENTENEEFYERYLCLKQKSKIIHYAQIMKNFPTLSGVIKVKSQICEA